MRKQKKGGTPAASQSEQDILVNVVLDRSGSMGTTAPQTISGYNEYLAGLRADKKTNYSISLIQFDSPGLVSSSAAPELTISYIDKPLADVPDLSFETYQPRGCTPLYDAIGECVRRVEAKGRPVVTVVITDGMENASKEFTQESIKALIKQKEAEGWKFVFLGANIDSFAVGDALGFAVTATANYAPGQEQHLYANLVRSTALYSSNVAAHGVMTANAMPFIDDKQRAQMTGHQPAFSITTATGGRQAAPPPFRPTNKTSRTKWTVRG